MSKKVDARTHRSGPFLRRNKQELVLAAERARQAKRQRRLTVSLKIIPTLERGDV